MRLIVIAGSRNPEGQTARAAGALVRGARAAGAECETLHLPVMKLESCRQCGDSGWGTCRSQGRCALDDDFAPVIEKLREADVAVFATPVYYSDLSESMRAFLDRLRRISVNEAGRAGLAGKPVVGVCVAGGGGGGAPACAAGLERVLTTAGLDVVDVVPARWQNLDLKLEVLKKTGEWLSSAVVEERASSALAAELRRLLLVKGASLVGFADLGALPAEARDGLPRGVSIAVALGPGIVAGIREGPTADYHAEYLRANRLLGDLAAAAAGFLERRGHRAKAIPATTMSFDAETLSSGLPHKTVATRAGLGWIGKCALLVTEEFGSAVRLASVLTDAPLPAGRPLDESGCGDCSACVEACPAGAPTGREWRAGLGRAEFFDAFACRAKATDLSERADLDHTVCGICIAACPLTRRYTERSRGPGAAGRGDG